MRQSEVLKKFSQLTDTQKELIRREVDDFLALNKDLAEEKPAVCPKCGEKYKMISHGHQKGNGKPRYRCSGCERVMTYDSCTIMCNLKISKDEFIEICRDTLNLVPISQTAARLDLSIPTVHLNRHKFLAVLEDLLEAETSTLSGTVEIDETYELESSKGVPPENRKARKRGEPSHFRGISREQVCIVTTTDRNGHEIFKAVGFGKPTSESITETFGKHIRFKSVIYTDGAFSYDQLCKETNCKLVQLYDYDSYNTVEHLNTVNSIHKLIKDTMAFYRGVSTKYINRYMALFVFIRMFMQMDDNEKLEILVRKIKSFHCHFTRESLKKSHLFSV
jgi:transposase-like protein